ncbi:hypothetical protein [Actinobacillus vicugnae]|uniref:hypothetical protein n=2 Tax=Actinobacillus TaxID=713 RepID=UPI001240388D|nr:hypothetical protein [Actinobacillus vicugnae]
MKIKLPKWLTVLNIVRVQFIASVIAGFIFVWLDKEAGEALMNHSLLLLMVLVYLEVMNLKDWHKNAIASLVKRSEILARVVYKLKQRGCKVTIDGVEQ